MKKQLAMMTMGGADDTPAGQQHQRDAKARHNGVHHIISAGAELQGLVVDDKVARDAEKCDAEHDIIPGKLPPVGVLGGRIKKEGKGNGQTQVGVAQDLQGDLVGDGRIELEQGPERQDDLNDGFEFAGKDLVFGLAVQRGKIDILGIDLFLFEKCHGGSPSVSGYTGFQDRYKKSGRAAVPCLIGTGVYFR